MQEKSESLILSEVFEDVRSLTKFYLSLAGGVDPKQQFEVNGYKLNTLYWCMGHIVWAEHFLLIESMTGEKMPIPWLGKFDAPDFHLQTDLPSMEDLLAAMEEVHVRAMAILLSLSDEQLGEPNPGGIKFRAGDARRVIIRHAIRHEPCHTGQMGLILRMNGVETV